MMFHAGNMHTGPGAQEPTVLSQLIVADLITRHPEVAAHAPPLAHVAGEVLAAHDGGAHPPGSIPQREVLSWAGTPVGLTGTNALQSAREAIVGIQVHCSLTQWPRSVK